MRKHVFGKSSLCIYPKFESLLQKSTQHAVAVLFPPLQVPSLSKCGVTELTRQNIWQVDKKKMEEEMAKLKQAAYLAEVRL